MSQMTCSKCNKESEGFITDVYLNIQNRPETIEKICWRCVVANQDYSDDLDELDLQIEEFEKKIVSFKPVMEKFNQDEIPENEKVFMSFALTPVYLYKSMLENIKNIEQKKKQILASMNENAKLAYLLKKAVENENYEEASTIHKKMMLLEPNKKISW